MVVWNDNYSSVPLQIAVGSWDMPYALGILAIVVIRQIRDMPAYTKRPRSSV